MFNKYKNLNNTTKGFTLVEVVVSMSIFLFIIGVAMNIFISIIKTQRGILFEQKIINQISYVEEYMSKALRMAKIDETVSGEIGNCLTDGVDGSTKQYIYLLTRPVEGFFRGIKFVNQSDNGACTEFFIDNVVHGNATTPLILKQLKNSTNNDDAVALTSTDLEIDYFRFAINGIEASTTKFPTTDPISDNSYGASKDMIVQPRLTLLLGIKIKGEQGEEALRIIQTTISERNLNVQ